MAGFLIGGRLVAGGGLDAGEITFRAIIPASASIELPLNSDGSIDADITLPLVDPITGASVDLTQLIIPGRDFIGWVENDIILEAGPVWGDPFNFPSASRAVANGIWSYFDHRYVLPVLAAGQLPRNVTSKWTGLSLGTIAKRLVQQALAHPGSGLPIDFLPDVAGDHEREYPGSDLTVVGDALRDLTNVENGPDITFRPKWGADRRHVRWDMLTGAPELTQAGDDHYWDVSVPDAHASITSLDRDGTVLSSREFQTGTTVRNLLSNSSFEEDISGWAAGGNSTNLRQSFSVPKHGAAIAGWDSVAAGMANLDSTQSITAEPGDVFRITAAVRASVVRPMHVRYQWRKADGSLELVTSPGVNVLVGGPWTDITFVGTAPANTTGFNVIIAGNASAGGQTFAVDSIMVTKGEEVIPYDEESITLEAVATDTTLLAAGFPLLESSTSRSSVIRTDTLQAYANETVVRGSAHMETLTISARRDKFPTLGTYWPGDHAKVRIGKNPRIPEGTYRVRIVTLTFQKNGNVTILCAPERVASGYPVPSTRRTWLRDRLRDLGKRIAETTRGT